MTQIDRLLVRGRWSQIKLYEGVSTITSLERDLSEKVVYVAGVPIKAKHSEILAHIEQLVEVQELFLPRSTGKNIRHFGFIICRETKDKEALIAMKQLKSSRYKLLFRRFNYLTYAENPEKLKDQQLAERSGSFAKQVHIAFNFFKGRASRTTLVNTNLLKVSPTAKSSERLEILDTKSPPQKELNSP